MITLVTLKLHYTNSGSCNTEFYFVTRLDRFTELEKFPRNICLGHYMLTVDVSPSDTWSNHIWDFHVFWFFSLYRIFMFFKILIFEHPSVVLFLLTSYNVSKFVFAAIEQKEHNKRICSNISSWNMEQMFEYFVRIWPAVLVKNQHKVHNKIELPCKRDKPWLTMAINVKCVVASRTSRSTFRE